LGSAAFTRKRPIHLTMALRHLGFAGLCLLLSVSAQNSKEAAPTAIHGACQKGSECSKEGTMPLGSFVQLRTMGGKSDMFEKVFEKESPGRWWVGTGVSEPETEPEPEPEQESPEPEPEQESPEPEPETEPEPEQESPEPETEPEPEPEPNNEPASEPETEPEPEPEPKKEPEGWEVSQGMCKTDSLNCVSSPNYPSDYGNNQGCIIQVTGNMEIKSVDFHTEGRWDKLWVDGEHYSGHAGPPQMAPKKITWDADYSITKKGWKLCPASLKVPEPTPEPTPAPTPKPPCTMEENIIYPFSMTHSMSVFWANIDSSQKCAEYAGADHDNPAGWTYFKNPGTFQAHPCCQSQGPDSCQQYDICSFANNSAHNAHTCVLHYARHGDPWLQHGGRFGSDVKQNNTCCDSGLPCH